MGKIMAVTMADVGRATGVSQAAVSLAFRRDPSIPVETRKRIFAAATRLGYRRHAAISSLMAQIRASRPAPIKAELGAITFWADRSEFARNATWQEQWRGARARAAQLGYALEEFCIGPAMTQRRLISVLNARNIDGLLIFPLSTPGAMSVSLARFSVVAIGYTLVAPQFHRVATAHFDAVLIALGQLRKRGYRRIGLVLDEQLNPRVRRNWQAAFLAYGLELAQLSSDAILPLSPQGGDDAFARWMRSYRPDAVVCGGAHPIRSWLANLGHSVPDEVGIVRLAALRADERCAHIDERWTDVGATAVDHLVGQMVRNARGVPRRPTLTLVRGQWIEGDSVRRLQASIRASKR